MAARTPLPHDTPVAPAGLPLSTARFIDLVADKLAATEEVFRRHLDSDVPFIHKAGVYISQGGGKRVRPALLLLAARLLGHDGEEEVTYAAVVEFIHTATLIHDDIIDHAALRRGKTTLNHLWGNNLTDIKYRTHYNPLTGSGTYQPIAEPMTYGGTIGYKF
jgi:hypothetical protein